jgi:hypothetical protein
MPGPDAGQVGVPGGALDARYEQLRHAALHARATAFPLGLGVLIGKGVTAWRRALAHLTHTTTSNPAPNTAQTPPGAAVAGTPQASVQPPDSVATELVHALAGLAVALAGT